LTRERWCASAAEQPGRDYWLDAIYNALTQVFDPVNDRAVCPFLRERKFVSGSRYVLSEAEGSHQFETASLLFQEYAAQLGIDLCFQDFTAELQALPVMYGPPSGCLVLAMNGATPVGCGALRRLSGGVCEMKRLYIRRGARGAGLGRRLAERLVDEARILGYETMRLDTLSNMASARNLYRSLGFREIKPYYANPLPNTIYLELALTRAAMDPPPAVFDPKP